MLEFKLESLPLPLTPSGWRSLLWQRDRELDKLLRMLYWHIGWEGGGGM